MKQFLLLFAICFSFVLHGQKPIDVLNTQIAAFNAQDVEAMTENLTDDFIWNSVMKDTTMPETIGVDAFKEAMIGYFSHFEEVQSKIVEYVVSGNVISFKEEVSWKSDKGIKSQSSIGVYLIEEGKISRAWYVYEE